MGYPRGLWAVTRRVLAGYTGGTVAPEGRHRRHWARNALIATVTSTSLLASLLGATAQSASAADAPTQLVFTVQPGDGSPGAALADQPQVTIEDASNGTVDSSSTISLTLTGPGGVAQTGLPATLTCTSNSVPASSGVATFAGCAIDRGGLFTLTATDATDNLNTFSQQIFISGPADLAFTGPPGGGTAGQDWTDQPQVTVEDAHGMAVTGSAANIQLAIGPMTGATGAALTCASNELTAVAGVATFSGCSIDKAGLSYELVATDGTDLLSTTSAAFGIGAGTASQVVFTQQPTSSAGGQAFIGQPQVAVEDAGGNIVTGDSDQVTLSIKAGTGASGASLTCAPPHNTVTAVNGVASFSGCSVNDAGSSYQLTATDSASSLSTDSNPFNISVGSAAKIQFTQEPGGGSGGVAFGSQPIVSLTDPGGNPVPGAVTLSIKPGTGASGASLTCGLNPLGGSGGQASFSGCAIDEAGTGYVLVATSGALQTFSQPFDLTGGSVAHALFTTPPGNGTGGSALPGQPVVTLTDAGGNPAAGSVKLSLANGLGTPGAKLTCAQNPVVAQGGVAAFSGCSVDQAGTGYGLIATIGSVTAQSTSFNVTVGPPAQLAFTAEPSGGNGGTVWTGQPTVVVEDAGGNQVTTNTASISLSVTSGTGNGTLSCTANSLPAVVGTANFSGCSIDKTASAYTLTATDAADGLTQVSAPFAVTFGPPAKLIFVGQPSGSTAGTVWAGQPEVAVADAGGNPVLTSMASIALSLTPGTGTAGSTLTCSSNSVPASGGVAGYSGCSVSHAAGGYTLTANDAAGNLQAESQPFSVTLPPPGPLEVAPTPTPLAQTFGGRKYGANPTDVTDDVNTATGALTFSTSDLTVAGIGEPLDLVRTYNSDDTTGGSFGPGWTSILDLGVQIAANHSTATVRGEDGQQIVFTWHAATFSWTPPPGSRASLWCIVNACTVTRFDGVSWGTIGGKLVDYVAPGGQGLTFSYSPGLVNIRVDTTNIKPQMVVAHLNSTGQVTQVTTPTRKVSYGYTGGLLTSFTDADGNTWTYSYSGGRLSTNTDPLGNVRLAVTYGPTGRVASEEQDGSPQLSDSTFGWNAATQTSTQTVQTSVDGTVQPETYIDQYLGNDLVAQTSPTGAIVRYSYDGQLNLTEVQDPLGWVQTMAYDSANNLITQTTPITSTSAAVVRMSYDPFHRLVSQTDADGNTTTYVYNGPLLSFVRPPRVAPGTSYSYNGAGELTLIDSSIGQQVISYDATGNQTGVVLETFKGASLDGRGTLATYNEAGQILSSVDPRGNLPTGINPAFETTWTYDADGNLLSHTTPGPQTTTYNYDAADDLTRVQAPDGTVTNYSWDQGTLTRSTSTGSAGTSNAYDPSGNLLTETTATGQKSAYVYDASGREISTTGANAVTVNYTYDIQGDVTGVTDSAGNIITQQYDAMSRLIRTVNNGAVTLDSYDPAGNIISTTDPDGAVATTTYNSFGKVASVTNAAGKTTYSYDQAGDLTTMTDPDGHTTTYTYDAAARQLTSTVNGATTTYGYDLAGNVDSVTDPDGRVTSYTLDAENQPTKTVYSWTGHPSETVTEQYNAAGERTQMVDPNGMVHNYTYDSSGDLTSASSGSNTFTYSYSTPGEIVEIYPDGTDVTYGMDDDNNLMSVQAGQPGDPNYVKAAYILNADRQTTGVAFSNGVIETDQLNNQGEVLNQSLQLAGTTLATDAFTYDAAGNRLTQVDNVGGTATTNQYGYDGSERLTSFSSSTAPAPLVPVAPPGAPGLTASAPAPLSGSSTAGPAAATVMAAAQTPGGDSAGATPTAPAPGGAGPSSGDSAQAAQTVQAPAGAPLFTASQATPGANSTAPTSPSASPGSPATAPASGLARTTGPSYAYDADGNQLSYTTNTGTTTYTYNASDEVTSERSPTGSTTWNYDQNGDVTKIAGPTSTQTFTYDAADHLSGVTTVSGGKTTTVTYTYDGDGNRTSETVGSTTTQFVWDPLGQYPQLALLENASGGLIERFIYGNGPVAMQTPTQTFFYHLDPQGSVAEMTNASGAIVAAYQYDGFGNVTTTGTSPPANPLLFQGQYYDSSTGLYYMRARNYDPTTGRFTQRDPVSPGAGAPFVSPYIFAADRPTYFTDPTGERYVMPTLSSVKTALFESHNTTAANDTEDTRDAVSALKLGVSAIAKSYSSAAEEAAFQSQAGIELDPATASLADTGDAIKVGGAALTVVGIGLETFITVEDCLHGTVQRCVADAVGTAVNVGFTVGCAVLTAGAGAVACGLAGAAIGIGLSYVIANYGPQIVAGLISVSDAVAQGVSQVAEATGQGLVQAGDDIEGIALTEGGAIATGFNELTTAVSSGLQTALTTLVQAGYTAVEIAGVLATTFKEGLDQTVAGLVSLGYGIVSVTQALASVFSATAAEAAQVLKEAFNFTATALAGALGSVYNLGEEAVATLLQGVNYSVDQVASALGAVFSDTAAGVAKVLNDIGYGVEQIGAALQQVFNEADNLAAQIMASIGYGATLIAGALQTLYNDADQAAAVALQFAAFTASEIAGALLTVFNDTAQAVASILNNLAFAVDDIASALNTVFNLADQAVAQILDDIGLTVGAIAGALKDVFGLVGSAVAVVLDDIGIGVDLIAGALQTVFQDTDQAVGAALQFAGFVASQIAGALQVVFNDTAKAVATILNGLTFTVDEIALALSTVFSLADEGVATVLEGIAGIGVDAIAMALADVFGDSAQAAAQVLEGIAGIGVDAIATALEDVFSQTANAVGQILDDIGESAPAIAQALGDVFGESASAIGNLLSGLGFSSSSIDAIGGSFSSFGQEVSNCFSSWFSDC